MRDDHTTEPVAEDGPAVIKRAALDHLERAWQDAEDDGIPGDAVAHAALFAALTELVMLFGEDNVSALVRELPDKIDAGDYTLLRTIQ